MEIEEIWGDRARTCIGKKIITVEIISICQLLLIVFENNTTIELTSCWRYRTEKSILLGSLDIGFFQNNTESKEEADELQELITEKEKHHYQKLNSLIGRTLKNIVFSERELYLEISGKRYIDWFCLSRDEFGFESVANYDQR